MSRTDFKRSNDNRLDVESNAGTLSFPSPQPSPKGEGAGWGRFLKLPRLRIRRRVRTIRGVRTQSTECFRFFDALSPPGLIFTHF
jgi:hypothetical protein